jgi:hypothetical protein
VIRVFAHHFSVYNFDAGRPTCRQAGTHRGPAENDEEQHGHWQAFQALLLSHRLSKAFALSLFNRILSTAESKGIAAFLKIVQ